MTLMLDANVPSSSRLRAADSVLDRGAKGIDQEDLELRLQRLEEVEKNKK